jgi:hypothetical protein
MMCGVPRDLWAPFATLHFQGHAAYWLKTFEAQHTNYHWVELCVAVDAKFGKEMYHNYMRDLLEIRQTTDVAAYHSRFVDAMHKVMLHHQGHDQVLFVQKFIDGLKSDISHAIMLHKPRTIDVAMSLAILQEEVLEASNKRYHPRHHKEFSRFSASPVSSGEKGILSTSPVSAPKVTTRVDTSEKVKEGLSNLKALRRARGGCFKCGAKWGRNHKCSQHVPLHVMEELLEVLQMEAGQSTTDGDASDSDTELLALSFSGVAGTTINKTMRLQGLCGKQELLILIDSGSSGSFISEQYVAKVGLQTDAIPEMQVSMAIGKQMSTAY